jgi:hypothetical protein
VNRNQRALLAAAYASAAGQLYNLGAIVRTTPLADLVIGHVQQEADDIIIQARRLMRMAQKLGEGL